VSEHRIDVVPADNRGGDGLATLLDVLAEIAISATERPSDGEGELRVAS
jgi:hypothetical protein